MRSVSCFSPTKINNTLRTSINCLHSRFLLKNFKVFFMQRRFSNEEEGLSISVYCRNYQKKKSEISTNITQINIELSLKRIY